ncbi:MAG: hypothetical protein HXS48_14850 [Theionarchaea archaeon]|nr:hypothetical protein [Theionarchaea archaeon]
MIVSKEKRKESAVDSITKRIKPVEDKVIDEAIGLTELGKGFESREFDRKNQIAFR